MKPDKVTCKNCGKEIERGKYCSDKCKQQAYRNRNTNVTPETVTRNEIEENVTVTTNVTKTDELAELRASLTKTDKTFYDRAMKDFGEPYYHYDGPTKKRKCGFCGESYTTNLNLNRYCSYQHYSDALKAVVR